MVKERDYDQRYYDVDGFKKRAACVCVKNENENEVLLISSSRNNNNWIVPGGGIEVNENPEEAAAREVYEEAGVQGRLGRFLGVFESINRKHRTSVYILIVDKEFEDWEEHKLLGRKRKWFNLNEAKSELEKHKPVQGTYLNLLKGYNDNQNSYFTNHTNINDININLVLNNNNNTDKSELNNNLHYNSNLSHQYSLISALSTLPTGLMINSPYTSQVSQFAYNSSPILSKTSTHLDPHDMISSNTTSLLNNTT